MKKFENLGRRLSKEEQKHILGGDVPGPDCPTGESNYHCCVEWANGDPTSNEDMCGISAYDAQTKIIEKHPNLVYHTECTAA